MWSRPSGRDSEDSSSGDPFRNANVAWNILTFDRHNAQDASARHSKHSTRHSTSEIVADSFWRRKRRRPNIRRARTTKAREIRKSAALLVRHTLAYPQGDGPVNVYLYCSDARSVQACRNRGTHLSSLDFQHQADFYDLFGGKMKKRTGPLRVAAQKHEYLLTPERHARLRRREKRETA